MNKMILTELRQWDIGPDQANETVCLTVRIMLAHPPMAQLVAIRVLKERMSHVRQFHKQALALMLKGLAPNSYDLIGSRQNPRGFTFQTTVGDLQSCPDESIISQVSILEVEGRSKNQVPAQESYYFVKLLFKVQVEGVRAGRQLFDHQSVIIKAPTLADAQYRLQSTYIPSCETPYFNSEMRLVRWQFVRFTHQDQVSVAHDWAEHIEAGIEVFSGFYRKRQQVEEYWEDN